MTEKQARLQAELKAIESDEFVPRTASGKQKSYAQVRNDIRKFLAEKTMTKGSWLREIGMNAPSFNKFMANGYKDASYLAENGTYLQASRYLARRAVQQKLASCAAPAVKKRAREAVAGGAAGATASKKQKKAAAAELLASVCAVALPERVPVYDDCDEVRRKVERFLVDSGVTQTGFLRAIGVHAPSWANFRKMRGKGSGASNKMYHNAYRFFEQKRLHDKKPKTKGRLESEARWGADGYALEHDYGSGYLFLPSRGIVYIRNHKHSKRVLAREARFDPTIDPRMDDIDYVRDRENAARMNEE